MPEAGAPGRGGGDEKVELERELDAALRGIETRQSKAATPLRLSESMKDLASKALDNFDSYVTGGSNRAFDDYLRRDDALGDKAKRLLEMVASGSPPTEAATAPPTAARVALHDARTEAANAGLAARDAADADSGLGEAPVSEGDEWVRDTVREIADRYGVTHEVGMADLRRRLVRAANGLEDGLSHADKSQICHARHLLSQGLSPERAAVEAGLVHSHDIEAARRPSVRLEPSALAALSERMEGAVGYLSPGSPLRQHVVERAWREGADHPDDLGQLMAAAAVRTVKTGRLRPDDAIAQFALEAPEERSRVASARATPPAPAAELRDAEDTIGGFLYDADSAVSTRELIVGYLTASGLRDVHNFNDVQACVVSVACRAVEVGRLTALEAVARFQLSGREKDIVASKAFPERASQRKLRGVEIALPGLLPRRSSGATYDDVVAVASRNGVCDYRDIAALAVSLAVEAVAAGRLTREQAMDEFSLAGESLLEEGFDDPASFRRRFGE